MERLTRFNVKETAGASTCVRRALGYNSHRAGIESDIGANPRQSPDFIRINRERIEQRLFMTAGSLRVPLHSGQNKKYWGWAILYFGQNI